MSEIDNAHNSKNQSQADPKQGIGTAEDQHVDYMLEKFDHQMVRCSTVLRGRR
jgi:hypothetical protein